MRIAMGMSGLAVLALAGTAWAQVPTADETAMQTNFHEIEAGFGEVGGARTLVTSFRATLAPSASQTFIVPLSSGGDYVFIGLCGSNCSNIDLRVTDAAGAVVGEDTQPDNFPIVRAQPTAAGTLRAQVTMRACLQPQCSIGLNVYKKN